ncbi:ribonuclease R [Pelosinus sp. IPA-1]|uniref:ribonuclease R n=1 Tax=Pelosinus sp. IPA-1 TaxID=3029569 RepID=UPI0024361512|nr:ribonuclease R [Pelosinus sp. IPA-1]GMB01039.1 ribonuclease R [Pelosinus sp. IPA-1]
MMILKNRILEFMKTEAYKPLTAEELAEQMELKGTELGELWKVIEELENNADIIKTRYDKYGVPERMNLVVGKLSASNKGYGFVIPEKVKSPEETDVFIPPDGMMSAMHHDRVVARVHCQSGQGKSRDGEIIRIVQRANPRIVGTYEASRNFGFVTPDDLRLGQDIFVPKDGKTIVKSGTKVVVEITKWPEKKRSAEGKIIEVLGNTGDTGIEILSIIKRHNLPIDFPPEVEQAAETAPDTISEDEIAGRRDLRHLPIMTIDGEDAKDLDDGVYVERLKNGNYLLGVYIADVSHYVRENTVLDKEARERGTSVYLVDRVLPMLPRRLSNGICSLNAGEDRLAMSAHMEVNHQGQVVKYELFPSVIRVKKRFSYTVVRKILVEHDEELISENQELLSQLENMERLCRILRDRRMRRGAIDFDFPELKVKLDETGKPIEIVKRVRSLAESIIEEFMLVANETVAEHMHKLKVPFVFRVHEEPDSEKMVKLNNLLHNFGQSLAKVDEVQPSALQKILSRISGRPEERIISTVMLRSLKQARYESQNLGHFGLAATYYTHFTSPIRRYPDLIVHRVIRETFSTGDISAKRKEKLTAMLPQIALHSSERERAAAEAERETVSLKTVEYMAQFVGEHFDGIINGVTAFGIFVELDNGVEGLVRVSSMEDDYYQYIEDQYSLIGERSHKIYRLGDAVKVILVRVSPEERNIDFVLEANSAWIERAANRRPSGARPQGQGSRGPKKDSFSPSKKTASTTKSRGNKPKGGVARAKPKRNKSKKK